MGHWCPSHPRQLPAEDAAEFVRASIGSLSSRHQVEVRIEAPAEVVRQRIGHWGALEDLGDGRCVLRMTSDSLEWPTLVLGHAAAEFEVLSPPALTEHLRAWGARIDRAVDPNRRV